MNLNGNNRFLTVCLKNTNFLSSSAFKGISLIRGLATVLNSNDSTKTIEKSNILNVNNDDKERSSGRFSSRVMRLARESIALGKSHFRVGEKELYFPKARVILLRPNSKHTPYQAKFIVPKSFNKLDLRDYLFHVYGLRAMNVTTQLLHGRYTRANAGSPRYREPQIKKMTIEMEQPFIWPEEPKAEENDLWDSHIIQELEKYRDDNLTFAIGSDKFKPGSSFGGALGPYKPTAQPFVPRSLKRKFNNQKRRSKLKIDYLKGLVKLNEFVNR
ncbi:hypothetical protein TPHA_0J02920 [Tetrapisispora phaffii CBS 4417]|uniref:Large ribosomal subunit protein uL23m n=1 Tax=Tetrapisispora phaffii (strain ATCC 24235 / CBS 4417 / NBRC 1672 / NRRL Y-8282 / UCD 70-5) TaxID=1071381 RepID=G8BY62_TETPH|nr:mitochondrial 54S ribosomal protein YmL41 TPHA_0J02920 [Tetrapisispora phaffii CBS 4417]CCE65113.1 hypothetical protein TPHA_0J02920 [Tetrapisispora phaffii CBS 4417]